jgi:glycosyltransferase involved in cell wall biosynthesis
LSLNVTLVTPYFPAHRGGVESVAGELAQRLGASGAAQITWHASDCDLPPSTLPGTVQCIPARSWNYTERCAGFPYPLWSVGALRDLVQGVRSCDVVHLHDCLYMGSIVALLASFAFAKPVLVTQHIGAVPYRNPLLRALVEAANRTVGAYVLRRATRVAFVSRSVQAYFGGFVRFRESPCYVPNGVDSNLFKPVPAKGRESSEPLLLFVGRFVEKKGLRLLRKVAASVPEARWVFAGWGHLDPHNWGLPNVRVVSGQRKEELVPLYQAADLLVLPSVGEGFPLVVQEAMACGTPALVSDETAAGCPDAGELLLTESLSAADTVDRWSNRIRSLIAARSSLAALRPRIAAFAATHWDWDRCTERYAALLRDCANRKTDLQPVGEAKR